MRTILLTVGLIVGASLSACESANSDPDPVPVTPPFAGFSLATLDPDAPVPTDEEADAMQNAVMAVLITDRETSPILRPRAGLSESEQAAQKALRTATTLDERGQTALRQIVASVMVQRHLNAPDPDVVAVGRYTQMLLDENSPNSHLLAQALPALEPTWGEARTHAAAMQGSDDATAYLARTCPACNAPAVGQRRTETAQTAVAGVVDRQRSIRDGIAALEAM